MIEVMVVDDDFRVAEIHREFVERCDEFQVVAVASTAREAVQRNEELKPDLVLLDLYLPDAHGLDIAQRIRADSRADIIVITAARDVASIKASMQHGVLHYLVKPFKFSEFRERLESYRDWRNALTVSPELSQIGIDAAFGALRPYSPGLPKGLSSTTLNLVEHTLDEAEGGLTSEEVAHLSGISRVTASRYLRFLVDARRAAATSEYGTPGRPKHRYSRKI